MTMWGCLKKRAQAERCPNTLRSIPPHDTMKPRVSSISRVLSTETKARAWGWGVGFRVCVTAEVERGRGNRNVATFVCMSACAYRVHGVCMHVCD